jgi:hypothetical protein
MQPFVPTAGESLEQAMRRATHMLSVLFDLYPATRFVHHIANQFRLDETAVSHHIDFLLHGVRTGEHANRGNNYFKDRQIPALYYHQVQDYAYAMRISSRWNIENGLAK